MVDSFTEFLALIGGSIATLWGITGMVFWLRWGFHGVLVIWRRRAEIDEEIHSELKGIIR